MLQTSLGEEILKNKFHEKCPLAIELKRLNHLIAGILHQFRQIHWDNRSKRKHVLTNCVNGICPFSYSATLHLKRDCRTRCSTFLQFWRFASIKLEIVLLRRLWPSLRLALVVNILWAIDTSSNQTRQSTYLKQLLVVLKADLNRAVLIQGNCFESTWRKLTWDSQYPDQI